MPKWTGNKANPSDINGGEQYKGGDRLSREAVNAIVNNSIYASEKSDEALAKADSAFMANGTVVRVNGIAEPFLDFSSAPQEQLDHLSQHTEYVKNYEIVYDMNSSNVALNWNQIGGLDSSLGEVSATFTGDCYRITAFLNANHWVSFYIKKGSYGGAMIKFATSTAFLYMLVELTDSYIKVVKSGYTNADGAGENSSYLSYKITKIERVY